MRVALVVLVLAAPAPAAPPAPPNPASQALAGYVVDPVKNRAALLALAKQGTDDLPSPVLLAVVDAYLREGQARQAHAVLNTLVARGVPADWTDPGLAWVALLTGDLEDARARYADLAARGTDSVPVVIAALLDAADGRTVEAVGALGNVPADPAAPVVLREVARLGTAYAYLWARDYVTAETAFTAVAEDFPNTRLTDDALYAAAWARFRKGDGEGALAALKELAGPSAGAPARASRDLLNLRPTAVLRAGRRHYGNTPFLFPADALAALLDVNGPALARAALRQVEAKVGPQGEVEVPPAVRVEHDLPAHLRETPQAGERAVAPTRRQAAAPNGRDLPAPPPVAPPASAGGWRRPVIVALLAVIVVVFLWTRQRRPDTAPRASRRAGRR